MTSKLAYILPLLMLSRVASAQDTIVLRVANLIDGKGGVQRNTSIAVKDSKIEKLGAKEGGRVVDLKKYTPVWPGNSNQELASVRSKLG